MAYIDREAFKEKYLCCGYLPEMSESEFDAFPTAEVEPVIQGHWEFVEREAFWITDVEEIFQTGKPTKKRMPVCSNCKTEFGQIVLRYKRCPECGAHMKKDGD